MAIDTGTPVDTSSGLPEDAAPAERQAPQRRDRGTAARAAHARPAARLRGVVDLRLRGDHPRRPGDRHPHRLRAGRLRADLVARLDRRACSSTRSTCGASRSSSSPWSIHLWGKFFMAAWRGRRRATWITGVVSFVVSVGAAFTGYLSQQDFDSQWISTQAKDGINSTGAGAIFNVTNFGQMLMWHIVLLPLVRGVPGGVARPVGPPARRGAPLRPPRAVDAPATTGRGSPNPRSDGVIGSRQDADAIEGQS